MKENKEESSQPDEISFFELWNVILHQKILVMAFPIVAILLSFLVLFLKKLEKPKWQAEALITIGAISKGRDPVESLALSQMRLQHYDKSFLNSLVSSGMSRPVDSANLEKELLLYRSTLKVNPVPPNILQVIVEGYSENEARFFVEATADRLVNLQKPIFLNERDRLKSFISLEKRKIDHITTQRNTLLRVLERIPSKKDSGSYFAGITGIRLLSNFDSQLESLESKLRDAEDQYDSPDTYPTSLFSVEVKEIVPISISAKKQIVAASGLLGLMLGIFVAFLRNSYQNLLKTI